MSYDVYDQLLQLKRKTGKSEKVSCGLTPSKHLNPWSGEFPHGKDDEVQLAEKVSKSQVSGVEVISSASLWPQASYDRQRMR